MAAAKTIRNRAGGKRTASSSYQEPVNTTDLMSAMTQLQLTVNKLISLYNTHAVAAHAGANQVAGNAAVTDVALFVTAP